MFSVLPSIIAPATGIDTLAARRAVAALFTTREQARREFEADAKARKLAAEQADAEREIRRTAAAMFRGPLDYAAIAPVAYAAARSFC